MIIFLCYVGTFSSGKRLRNCILNHCCPQSFSVVSVSMATTSLCAVIQLSAVCWDLRHEPEGLLEELQSPDCDDTQSGPDPPGLVPAENKPADPQNQKGAGPGARHCHLRLILASSSHRQEQLKQPGVPQESPAPFPGACQCVPV